MFTDHSTLKYLVKKPVLGGRIYRWLLMFQEFDFEVIVKSWMIRIWTRGQILPQKSKFSELPKNKWVCSPRRHEPNAIRFVSNGRRERKLSRSVRRAKQVKKVLTGQSVRPTRGSDVA
jgi:hypothetical protein